MKFEDIHIGSIIKSEVLKQGLTLAAFAQSINIQRQNVDKKVFSQKGLATTLLVEISEKLNCNFFDYYYSKENRNYKGLHQEVKATLTIELGEKKEDKTFRFLFGENDIKIMDNNLK